MTGFVPYIPAPFCLFCKYTSLFSFSTHNERFIFRGNEKHPVNRLNEESSRVWRVEWGVRSFRILC